MYEDLKHAIEILANQCDGAQSRDTIGFNGGDSPFGKWLACQTIWREKWAIKAYQMLQKYRNTQLKGLDLVDPSGYGDEGAIPLTMEELEYLEWSEPKYIRKVGKEVRNCFTALDESFWALWKQSKNEMKALGYSVTRNEYGTWTLAQWTSPREESLPPPTTTLQPIAAPEFHTEATKLFPYQVPHAEKMTNALRKYGIAVDSSDTGTGKTYVAGEVARQMGFKLIIICPKPIMYGWIRMARDLGVEIAGIANYEAIKTGKYFIMEDFAGKRLKNRKCPYITIAANSTKGQYQPKWLISWNLPEKTIVVIDEAHRCKNRDTINAQLLYTMPLNVPKMLLSATLAESPLKMYALGHALGFFNVITDPWDFWSWCRENGCSKNKYGWDFYGGARSMQRIHDQIGEKMSGMRVKELIAAGKFPESQILAEAFDLNGETDKINSVYSELEARIEELKEKKNNAMNILTEIQKAHQAAELYKLKAVVEMAEDAIEEGRSVAIFVNYTETLKAMCEKLKTSCTIYGENNTATNEANRLRFERNEERVIICNIAAAREGIDLHDKYQKYPRTALIMPTYSAQNLKQVLGRVHRAGGTPSQQIIVFAARTVEEEICERVNEKLENLAALNDADFESFF